MNRMTFKYYRALKATLDMLSNKCSKGVLVYGAGTEWHRTVDASDIQKLAKEGEKYLPQLMKKYKEPQKKQEWVTARVNPYTGI